jgi:hypothetical protein
MRTPESHAKEIACWIARRVIRKYRRGQREHGGRVWERECFRELLDEITDLVVYAHIERERRMEIRRLCRRGLKGDLITAKEALRQIERLLCAG